MSNDFVLTNVEKAKISIIENKLQEIEKLIDTKDTLLEETAKHLKSANDFYEALSSSVQNMRAAKIVSLDEYRSVARSLKSAYDIIIRKNNECIMIKRDTDKLVSDHILLENELNHILKSSICKILEFKDVRFEQKNK